MQRFPLPRSRGGALISALFITAIAAVIATALAVQEQLLIHEGELVLHSDQQYLNLQSMQNSAKNSVNAYASQFLNLKNPPQQVAPLPTHALSSQLGDMTMTMTIENESGKFNLNDLVYTQNQPRFVALLKTVLPTVPRELAVAISQSITAWMMTGADDRYYLSLHPAYRSSEDEFTDISELKLIKGVDAEIYGALKPYVTAVPIKKPVAAPPGLTQTQNETPIDVNSVSAPVLITIIPTLNVEQAQAVIACKGSGAFGSVQAFITNCGAQAGITQLPNVIVGGNYYLVTIKGTQAGHTVALKSLLVTRHEKNNTLKTVIGWQEFI